MPSGTLPMSSNLPGMRVRNEKGKPNLCLRELRRNIGKIIRRNKVSDEYSFGPAKDAKEQLRRWDAGDSIWSIELGGLGPGYEQAIQIAAIEIVRDNLGKPLPDEKNWSTWGDHTISRIDQRLPDGKWSCGGFSGAQVGAAKQLAHKWLKDGPAALLKEVPNDRHIQVSKFWPRAAGAA
jgi:hypothetical protein